MRSRHAVFARAFRGGLHGVRYRSCAAHAATEPMVHRSNAFLLSALATIVLGGCRSADGWREQADRDVYRLVRERRAKLGAGDGSFTIDPNRDSLRQQLLRGEVVEQAPLTLVQCLEIAAENSRDYQTQKESLYLSALDLTLERWQFQAHPAGVLSAAVAGTGDTAETATGDEVFALSQLFGTGAQILGDIGLNLSRSLTSGDSWNPVGDLGLAITQPLLRGSGSQVVLEPLTQAERDLLYAARTFERFRRTFAFDVTDRFYAMLKQRDAVLNQQTNYQNLVVLSQRNAALAEAGRLSDIEAGQARQNELRSRDNLLRETTRFELLADEFRILLGLPPNVPMTFDLSELERLAEQDLAPIEIDEGQATAYALSARLDHLNTVDQSQDSDRKVYVAEDALRAGLTLAAEWRNSSEAGTPATLNFQDSTWSLAAVLDLPLDRLPERNTYRAALIQREVSRRAVERSSDSISGELREELRETKSQLESWKIQQNAVELAERRVESIDLKLQAGRADTRDLLDAQEALLQARNSESAALVDYNLSRLALYRDMELLRVDANGVHVEELAPGNPAAGTPGDKDPARADAGGQNGSPVEPEKVGA